MRYLIGIGTYMAMDDSIGLRVAEAISAGGLDHGFRAIEMGGNLVDLIHYLEADTERVLIVDSANMGSAPGEFAFFTPQQVVTRKAEAGISTHEGDLLKVLELAEALGQPLPPVMILGVQPGDMNGEVGLSPELTAWFDEYVRAAVEYMTREDPQD